MSGLASVPTADEVRRFPVVVDVPTAGRCFGLGRDVSYDLARLGKFPVPVLRLGASLRVTRAALLAALGIADTPPAPSNPLATDVNGHVKATAGDMQSAAPSMGVTSTNSAAGSATDPATATAAPQTVTTGANADATATRRHPAA